MIKNINTEIEIEIDIDIEKAITLNKQHNLYNHIPYISHTCIHAYMHTCIHRLLDYSLFTFHSRFTYQEKSLHSMFVDYDRPAPDPQIQYS